MQASDSTSGFMPARSKRDPPPGSDHLVSDKLEVVAMKKFRNPVLVMILLLFAVPSRPQNTQSLPAVSGIRHVWVISVDGLGLSPDGFLSGDAYMHTDYRGPWVPTLRQMVQKGVFAEHLLPVLPADSYPSEVSIATGFNPGSHGIVTNKAWDPFERNMKGWRWYSEDIRVPTLWELAKDRGLVTALISWPCTVGARADVLVPDFWRAHTKEDEKLLRSMSTPNFFDHVMGEYPELTNQLLDPNLHDEAITNLALDAIKTKRPELLMLHLIHPVFAQHVYGPSSEDAEYAFEDTDRQIERLIEAAKDAGIWDDTVIVLVSGFSFRGVSHSLYPGVLLAQAGLVTLDQNKKVRDWRAIVISNDGTAYIYVKDPKDKATMERVRQLFVSLAAQPESGIRRVLSQADIAKFGGDSQAYLAVEAAEDFTIEDGYDGLYKRPTDENGTHGFLPDAMETGGTALIYGPQIKPGFIENARLVDIAPTVAQWLSLTLGATDGSPLPISLRPLQATHHR
jgi:predicted AlkP superfamily pyrophosphatase or phosphodiesterase